MRDSIAIVSFLMAGIARLAHMFHKERDNIIRRVKPMPENLMAEHPPNQRLEIFLDRTDLLLLNETRLL